MTDSPVSKVLQQLYKVTGSQPKRNGQGYKAQCPAHEDKNPSLSVSAGDNGRVLLHCHAGCRAEDVVAALRLKMSDLMPGRVHVYKNSHGGIKKRNIVDVDGNRGSKTKPSYSAADAAFAELDSRMAGGVNGQRVGQWPYHDADGQVVAYEVRYDLPTPAGEKQEKTFRPVSHHPDGWRLSDPPGKWPLYGLPDLLAAGTDGPVHIVEGEKAADAVRSLGWVATTSAHGAKSVSKTDWSPLAGSGIREVVILPDNDEAGEGYASDVVKLLSNLPSAPVIRVIRLPELPEHGDAHDWVVNLRHAGRDDEQIKAELVQLVEAIEPIELTAESKPDYRYVPFPVEVLPEPMRSLVANGSKAIGCDASYIASPMLSALASAIGNTRSLQLKMGWAEPAIVWTAIVGDSGTTKSPALDLALRPVHERQGRAMRDYQEKLRRFRRDLLKYERELAAWKKSKADEDPPEMPEPPIADRYVCSDTTVEAAAVLLLNHATWGVDGPR